MNYDAIVIGAGLGGLTAGAQLAKEGKKVLLIEQHSIPGGCATTFKRKDLKIEVGLHMIDGLDDGDPKKEYLKNSASSIIWSLSASLNFTVSLSRELI